LETYFVDVILPLALGKHYTYRIPADFNQKLAVGKRVVVQFGKAKIYSAIIARIHQQPPERYEAKYILDVLDPEPVVNQHQLDLWTWIADYYMCSAGSVMQAALPSVLKLASETKIIAADLEAVDRSDLSDKEFLILDALEIEPEIKVSDIVKLLGQKTVLPILKGLLEKGILRISEEVAERFKPKKQVFVQLNPVFDNPSDRQQLFESLNRAPRQMDALMAYIHLKRSKSSVSRNELMEQSGCGSQAIKALADKQVFLLEEQVVSRIASDSDSPLKEVTLSEVQSRAFEEIQGTFTEKDIVLLHGITASGKTEIYIQLIHEAIRQGKTALYLLPEIALTTQIIERLKFHFGAEIGVYHSRLNENERAEVWRDVLNGRLRVLLGARSAVFLPFFRLGLVIVDEEHEVSYKQYEPAPRYQARDTAIFLGHLHGAKVLLGSATPSVETYYHARAGKYGLVRLDQRFGAAQLPEIEIVPLNNQAQHKTGNPYFTPTLLKNMEAALSRKEQIILFQNRRGHTPFLLCATCGYSPKCIHCDVSLTYHKSSGKLHCHYCAFREDLIHICPACGSSHIENKGFGTQRIEEELGFLLPDARIGRLDLDSTRSRYSFEKILNDFDEHRLDILVGTQMVTKGLDFGRVSLIGIINADSLINYPDFRAFERSFAMLSQVSGRAGRRDVLGKVIIQAYATGHRILEQVVRHDYENMFLTEVNERKQYRYPPFYRLIRIEVKHKDNLRVVEAAHRLALRLRQQFDDRVLGPEEPMVSRVRNMYINSIMLKLERSGLSISKVKEVLADIIREFNANKLNKGTYLVIDVDPY
jgi:primosomal protein N' (replication factor Y)